MKRRRFCIGALAVISCNAAPIFAVVAQQSVGAAVPKTRPPVKPINPGAAIVPTPSPSSPTPTPSASPNLTAKLEYALIYDGSYNQTCKNIVINGKVIQAVCKRKEFTSLIGGGWAATSIDSSECFLGTDISNEDGRLECWLPGSYRQSCKTIKTSRSQDSFTAVCKQASNLTQSGNWVAARLNSVSKCRSGTIENLDGILACNRQ